MTRLVTVWGTGDTYLVAALHGAFCRRHGREARLVVRSNHAAIVDLFPGVPYEVNDALAASVWGNDELQSGYDNVIGDGDFYVHPMFVRTRTRIDQLTSRPEASQADMYRMLMQLPPSAPLTLPVPPAVERATGVVVLVEANSWPNTQPEFWPKLVDALRSSGRDVWVNDRSCPMDELLRRIAAADWVIGPQCGVMSVAATGRFPCRKTFLTPDIDGNRCPDYWAEDTYPYAYVTKFANDDFDAEEYKITDDNHGELIGLVLGGINARALRPHDPSPVMTVMTPLSPGDFLDRLAVLEVKRSRFDAVRRAGIEREYRRLIEIRRHLDLPPAAERHYASLVALHGENFDLLQRCVPEVVAGGRLSGDAHEVAMRMNRVRVGIRLAIDDACHAPYGEVKSYYDEI